MFTKKEIEDLNSRFFAAASLKEGGQLAFEEGAFLALDAIERVCKGGRSTPKRKLIATESDYARLDALVSGN